MTKDSTIPISEVGKLRQEVHQQFNKCVKGLRDRRGISKHDATNIGRIFLAGKLKMRPNELRINELSAHQCRITLDSLGV